MLIILEIGNYFKTEKTKSPLKNDFFYWHHFFFIRKISQINNLTSHFKKKTKTT